MHILLFIFISILINSIDAQIEIPNSFEKSTSEHFQQGIISSLKVEEDHWRNVELEEQRKTLDSYQEKIIPNIRSLRDDFQEIAVDLDQLTQEYKRIRFIRQQSLPKLQIIQESKEKLGENLVQEIQLLFQTTQSTEQQEKDHEEQNKNFHDFLERNIKQETETNHNNQNNNENNNEINNNKEPNENKEINTNPASVGGVLAISMFLFGFVLEFGQKYWLKMLVAVLPRDWIVLSMLVGTFRYIVVFCLSTFSISGTPLKLMFFDRSLYLSSSLEQQTDNGKFMLLLFCFISGFLMAEIWVLIDRVWTSMLLIVSEKSCFYVIALSLIGEPNRSKFVLFTCVWFSVSLLQLLQEFLMALTLMTTKHFNLDFYIYATKTLFLLLLCGLSYSVMVNTKDHLDFTLLGLICLTGIQTYKFYWVAKDWFEGEEEEFI
jgi:hypothetical protein